MFRRFRRFSHGGEIPGHPVRRRFRLGYLRTRRGWAINTGIGIGGAVTCIVIGHLRQDPVSLFNLALMVIAALLIPVHLSLYAHEMRRHDR